jgi:hypothetical protein
MALTPLPVELTGTHAVEAACVRVLANLAKDAAPLAGDFEPTACGEEHASLFRYDPVDGVLKAKAAIALGEIVAAPSLSLLAAVRAGETFQLRIKIGPVAVERTVTALRAARLAKTLLVRTDDGVVLSVPFPSRAP